MVNEVLTAVTTQLGKTFGTEYKYYVEDVKQGLTKPCFTVDTITPISRSRSPLLYDRTFPLVIHYFTTNVKLKEECYSIAERAVECLEYLPINDRVIRGEDINWHIVDDVLQIFITYKVTTTRVVEVEDSMEDIVNTSITRIQ